MALYSPNQQKRKTPAKFYEPPTLDTYGLGRGVFDGFGMPSMMPPFLSQTSETGDSGVPPLDIAPPVGFPSLQLPIGQKTFSTSDDMPPLQGFQGMPPSDSTHQNLDFQDSQAGRALDHYLASIAELQNRAKTDPSLQYGDASSVRRPSYVDPGVSPPVMGSQIQDQTREPALDAALISTMLGGILGVPGYGAHAGAGIVGGAMSQAGKDDATKLKFDQNAYDDALRSADRRYSQDVDRYGIDVRSIDAKNSNIARRMNDEKDAITSKYNTEQRAETAAERERGLKNRETARAYISMMNTRRLSPEDEEKVSKALGRMNGLELSGLMDTLTPAEQERVNYLTKSLAQRKEISEATLKAANERAKSVNTAANDRLTRVLQGQKERQAIANSARKEIAEYSAWVRTKLAAEKPGTRGYNDIKGAEEKVKRLHVEMNRQITSLNNADARLQSSLANKAKLSLKPEFIDPTYKDPKDPDMDGLNELGRSAMSKFKGVYNSAFSAHSSQSANYEKAKRDYDAAVMELDSLVSGKPQTYDTTTPLSPPPLTLNGMDGRPLDSKFGTGKPQTSATKKTPGVSNMSQEQKAKFDAIVAAIKQETGGKK